jgi:hypothetical protein
MDINGTMTPDQLRDAFVAEFRELLNRYNAEFAMVDQSVAYENDLVPVIYFHAEWDANGNATRESSEFFLNDYV